MASFGEAPEGDKTKGAKIFKVLINLLAKTIWHGYVNHPLTKHILHESIALIPELKMGEVYRIAVDLTLTVINVD
jgi:hypothetical protein